MSYRKVGYAEQCFYIVRAALRQKREKRREKRNGKQKAPRKKA